MKYKCILWVCLNHRRCVYSFQSCMPGSANVASKSTPALIIANMIKQTMRRKTMQVIIMQAVVGEPSKEQQKHLKTILFLGTPFSWQNLHIGMNKKYIYSSSLRPALIIFLARRFIRSFLVKFFLSVPYIDMSYIETPTSPTVYR